MPGIRTEGVLSSVFFRLSRRGMGSGCRSGTQPQHCGSRSCPIVPVQSVGGWNETAAWSGVRSQEGRTGSSYSSGLRPQGLAQLGSGAFSCQPSDRRPQLHHVPSDPAGGPVRYRSDTKRPQPAERTTSHTAWGALGHNRPKQSSPQTSARLLKPDMPLEMSAYPSWVGVDGGIARANC